MKKSFIFLTVFLFYFRCAFSSIGYVQGRSVDSGTVTSGTLAFLSNTTARNMILVTVRVGSPSTTVTVTDSSTNTFQLAVSTSSSGNSQDYIYYAENILGGADTVTVTLGASRTLRWSIHEASGLALGNSLDQTGGNHYGTAVGTVVCATFTTTQNDEFILGMAAENAGDRTWIAGTGYTIAQDGTKQASIYRITTTAGTYTPTMSIELATDTVETIAASFKGRRMRRLLVIN